VDGVESLECEEKGGKRRRTESEMRHGSAVRVAWTTRHGLGKRGEPAR
jgi:hypothetical protein